MTDPRARRASAHGLLALLQLADSAFPVGGFAHSDGLEALVRMPGDGGRGSIHDVLAAHAALSVASGDVILGRLAHEATARGSAAELRAVAASDTACRTARAQRQGQLSVGAALLRAVAGFGDDEAVAAVGFTRAALGDRTPRVTVFASLACGLGADEKDTGRAIAYVVLAGMVGAAVRLRLLGAIEAQQVLRSALAIDPPAADPGAWGFASPLLEIATMRHDTLAGRLFAS